MNRESQVISALFLITLMPLQIQPNAGLATSLHKPVAVKAFVDTAKILGLPKLRLRDDKGNPYLADKTLRQEPLAVVYDNAGVIFMSEVSARKAYILSYVRR